MPVDFSENLPRLVSSVWPGYSDDLSRLDILDEKIILEELRARFEREKYYTFLGDVLVSINPNHELPIFDSQHHEEYKRVSPSSPPRPHIFWMAQNAYENLLETKRNQCIVVSGESGAGKTESTKFIIRHLVHLSPSSYNNLHEKIVEVNPLLEAFGNSRTAINDNSSRFGKFVEIFFNEDHCIIGAKINDYLLEKSRVVRHGAEERNFHIFYYMFAGMSKEKLLHYDLSEPVKYRIMHQRGIQNRSLWSETEFRCYQQKFHELIRTMKTTGFSEEDTSIVFTLLSAILHLTNLQVKDDVDTDGVQIEDEFPLCVAANLLQVDVKDLTTALISNVVQIRGENVKTLKKMGQAEDGRDALAKALYSRLFGWTVGQINSHLYPSQQNRQQNPCVGILDMSGFERCPVNSFEQLCINTANERLQTFFTENLFVQELKEYEEEGVSIADIQYYNNQPLIDLFFKKPEGIFYIIDEESSFPKATDFTLTQKLNDICGSSPFYQSSAGNANSIVIKHYAGKVTYATTGFLEKNRDSLSQNLSECMARSKNKLLRSLFTVGVHDTNSISAQSPDAASKRWDVKHQSSVCRQVRKSLNDLISKMSTSKTWFIRCLRANKEQKPRLFTPSLVMEQLRCNGLLEIAKIRRCGFAVRLSSEDFVSRYRNIGYSPTEEVIPNFETCEKILRAASVVGYKFGKEKIFLHHWDVPILQSCLEKSNQEWAYLKSKADITPVLKGEEEMKASRPSTPVVETLSKEQRDTSPPTHERVHEWIKQNEAMMSSETASTVFELPAHLFTKNENASTRSKTRYRHSDHVRIRVPEESQPSETLSMRQWDRFQIIPRERISSGEQFKPVLKVCKVFCYFFLFCVVLALASVSKLTVLLLATSIPKTENSQSETASKTMLLLCVVAPYASWFVFYTVKSFFGATVWPSWRMLAAILFIELLHTFGLTLLLFRVLPRVDIFHALVIMSGLFTVPASLKMFTVAKDSSLLFRKRLVLGLVNSAALLVQAAALPLGFALGIIMTNGEKADLVDKVFRSKQMEFNVVERLSLSSPDQGDVYWECVVATLLVSVVYWENYVDGDITIGHYCLPFTNWKKTLHLVRERLYIFVSVWKVTWTVVFALFFLGGLRLDMKWLSIETGINGTTEKITDRSAVGNGSFDASTSAMFQQEPIFLSSVFKHLEHYGPLYIQLFSSLCCSYFSGLACKLCMQNLGFSLPLILTTPFCFLLVFLQCYSHFIPHSADSYVWVCPSLESVSSWNIVWLFLLWLSRLIICSHTWFPQSGRLAKIERLFVLPMRCGILTEESLLLRRRRNDRDTTFLHSGEDDLDSEGDSFKADDTVPVIYACATMWHETRAEMTQLLKSIFRMDIDHSARFLAQTFYIIKDPDYYEFEAHLFFDDAMELTEDDTLVPNTFVKELIECVEDALSSVHERQMMLGPPVKTPTPYGGRLTWKLPGGTRMMVHMKDKHKIRHKKRWSQVMYMYYLLGYRIMAQNSKIQPSQKCSGQVRVRLTPSQLRHRRQAAHFTRSIIFNYVDEDIHTEAENTYLLTLDGDVDFKPDAVRLLVDRLKKNKKVGAACGRIHPTGSGPMLWYQEFEYAIGHWLQKATEHVFGCVMCAPGCFSLFRGSALMDDNVAKMYTIRATEAGQYVQCDQGEDRWLSTLLLQQGYRIDYCAASDALTHAPDTFSEFFNQRRRWGPSTLANIIDLLGSWKNTVRTNDNISTFYVLYQFSLLVSTVLGPATILIMMSGSFNVVLKISLIKSYAMSLCPAIFYIIFCMVARPAIQVSVAAIMSACYAIVMMVVVVGTLLNAFEGSLTSPNVVFLIMLAVIFILAAIFHPEEVFCIIPGVLYFICLPSGYLILTIYYLCNLHVVSWGTREMPKKKSREELEKERREDEEKKIEKEKKNKGVFAWLGLNVIFSEVAELLKQLRSFTVETSSTRSKTDVLLEELILEIRENRNGKLQSRRRSESTMTQEEPVTVDGNRHSLAAQSSNGGLCKAVPAWVEKDSETNPAWLSEVSLGNGLVKELDSHEMLFWKQMIKKYLHPIAEEKQHQERVLSDLKNLRNNVVFGFFMTSSLWIALQMQLEVMQDELKDKLFFRIPRVDENAEPLTFEPLGMIFLSFFAFIVSFQFLGMLIHRWGTILHMLSITQLSCGKTISEAEEVREVIQKTMEMQRVCNIENEPHPDYSEESETNSEAEEDTSSSSTEPSPSDIRPPSYHSHEELGRRRSSQQRRKEIFSKHGYSTGHTLRRAFERRYRRMLKEQKQSQRALQERSSSWAAIDLAGTSSLQS